MEVWERGRKVEAIAADDVLRGGSDWICGQPGFVWICGFVDSLP